MFFPPWWRSPYQWLGNLTLTEEWRHLFWGDKRNMILGVAWTLCYEEQFYLVSGIIAWLFKDRRKFFTMLAFLTLCTIPFFDNKSVRGLFFDGSWLSFAAGVFAYYLIHHQKNLRLLCALTVFTPAVVFAARWADWSTPNNFYASFLVASIYGLLLFLLYPKDIAIQDLALVKGLNFFGRFCYSLYLIHSPIVFVISYFFYRHFRFDTPGATIAITVPICLALSIAAGSLFHRLVESKFINRQ